MIGYWEFLDDTPGYDFFIMEDQQTLFDITKSILNRIREVLEREHSDEVLVYGDTSTTFEIVLAYNYLQIPARHVEARIRTYKNLFPISKRIQQ